MSEEYMIEKDFQNLVKECLEELALKEPIDEYSFKYNLNYILYGYLMEKAAELMCKKYNFHIINPTADYTDSWTNKIERPLPNKSEWEKEQRLLKGKQK
jgi:hypothetical protein